MRLEYLKNARILILGFGKEGIDTLLFLRRLFPKKILGIADQKEFSIFNSQFPKLVKKEKKVRLHLGKNYLKSLKNYDIIIKSPGIPIHLPEVERVFKKGKITSQAEIFFRNCPGKIVGVTGTKGKGTTASLIYEILREGGVKAHLVGNIEKPVLQYLFSATKKDVFVFELSSHQLYKLKKSPQIAVFLNLYPAHLEFFKNFKEYILAKTNIVRYQNKSDYFIYNSGDKIVREIAKKSRAKKIPIPTKLGIFKNLRMPLIGKFNLLNVVAAIEVGKLFKISKEKIIKGIKNFKPLPHRLEFVGKYRGIKFYNDSLATIPESSIVAIEALGNKVGTVILGGSESNVDIGNLAKKILKSKINNLIFFPTTGEKIWKSIRQAQDKVLQQNRNRGLPKHLVVSRIEPFFVNNMKDAVDLAYKNTGRGKICLLSPAYPSFSLFKDYKERGNLFKKFVKNYAKRK
jgi:UDP-N-acetylmuramoylalanine--D-glutamate ligase